MPAVRDEEAETRRETSLFPERAELQAARPTGPALFEQETWRELGTTYQHCWEWGFEIKDVDIIERDLARSLRTVGLEPVRHGSTRRDAGLVVFFGGGHLDSFRMEGDIAKLAICTEQGDTGEAFRQFVRDVTGRAHLPQGAPFTMPPNLAFERRYVNGTIALGVQWLDVNEVAVTSWLVGAGLHEVASPPRGRLWAGSSGLDALVVHEDLWLRRLDGIVPTQ